jgi:hypothetical protein
MPDKPKTLHDKLVEIQQKLNAPKGQHNNFGGYDYRSCEDILTALKPLLGDCAVILNDELVMIGDRFYVKATATLTDGKDNISTTAYAREELVKKGMDGSQITGSSSSYARKYAMNGLFSIDDTKDADSTNKHEVEPSLPPLRITAPMNQPELLEDSRLCSIHNITMPKKVSQKTGKPYWSHMVGQDICFGGGVVQKKPTN